MKHGLRQSSTNQPNTKPTLHRTGEHSKYVNRIFFFFSFALLLAALAKMKVAICLLAVVAVALAAPQERDGAALTNEAIRQAQSQQLIPRDATIQGVQEGIQVAAIESIPGDQRVDLFQLLGDQVPREVISNLQSQVDQVGHN